MISAEINSEVNAEVSTEKSTKISADLSTEMSASTADFLKTRYSEALFDFSKAIKLWRLWTYMAMTDIRRRYRRTIIGPFWTTINLGVFIGAMGILFSYLWKSEVSVFLPYFASGYIVWMLISTILNESCTVFIAVEGLAKQVPLPFSVYAFVLITRNLIVLAHHLVVFLLIIVLFKVPINMNFLLIIPGVILLSLMGFGMSILLGLVCARYRDIQQVITSLLQVCMFITPIFWKSTQLAGLKYTLFVNCNPLYHFINIIRKPILGECPELFSWNVTLFMSIGILAVTFLVFAKFQRKLIFWL